MKNETPKKHLDIRFGVAAPKIAAQLKKQKLKFKEDDCKHFDMDSEALSRLRIRGLLTGNQINAGFEKLFKNITAHVKKMNPEKPNTEKK